MTFRTKKKNPQNLACSLNLVTFGTVKKMNLFNSEAIREHSNNYSIRVKSWNEKFDCPLIIRRDPYYYRFYRLGFRLARWGRL